MPVELSLRALALVAGGSALGGGLRYAAQIWLSRPEFPWGTVAVNLGGSFLLGLLMASAFARGGLGPEARLFLAVGVLGGFTTMSTFAYETIALAEGAHAARAVAYAALNVVGSVAMAALGMLLARLV